jgi:hypothetical protein
MQAEPTSTLNRAYVPRTAWFAQCWLTASRSGVEVLPPAVSWINDRGQPRRWEPGHREGSSSGKRVTDRAVQLPFEPPPSGEGRRGRHQASEQAQQRAERRDHSSSPQAITPSAPPHCGPVPGISSSRRTRRGGHSRCCPHYHPLRAASIMPYLFGRNLSSSLTSLYLAGSGASQGPRPVLADRLAFMLGAPQAEPPAVRRWCKHHGHRRGGLILAVQRCTTMEDYASQREPSWQASQQVPRSLACAALSTD